MNPKLAKRFVGMSNHELSAILPKNVVTTIFCENCYENTPHIHVSVSVYILEPMCTQCGNVCGEIMDGSDWAKEV